MNISDISLKVKIYGIVSGMLVGMVVLALSGVISTSRVSDFVAQMELYSNAMDRAESVKISMLQARRAEKDFLLRKDVKYVDANAGYVNDVKKYSGEIQNLISVDNFKKKTTEINKAIDEYSMYFNQVVSLEEKKGLDEKKGLRGSFRNAVHEIEDVLKKQGRLELGHQMLMIRRREKDYLLRGTDKYITKTAEEVELLKKMVKESDLSEEVKNDIFSRCDKYISDFNSLVSNNKQIASAVSSLRDAVHRVSPLVDELVGISRESSEKSGVLLSELLARVRKFQVAVSTIMLVVFSLLGWLIAQRIMMAISEAERIVGIVADGDFTEKAQYVSKDEMGVLCSNINKMIDNLRDLLFSVNDSANHLASASEQMASGAQQISDGVQQQSASFEELSASLEANADSAQHADSEAKKSASNSEQAGDAMDNTIASIATIEKTAQKIANAVDIITDIADQTNLLALNAAIEAARAGEHGKGFAVVADEVRKLAERSAVSAREITGLITESLRQVQSGVDLSGQAGEKVKEILLGVNSIADEIEMISSKTREQSATMEENTAITESNASAAEELSASSEELAGQAEKLRSLVQEFRLEK